MFHRLKQRFCNKLNADISPKRIALLSDLDKFKQWLTVIGCAHKGGHSSDNVNTTEVKYLTENLGYKLGGVGVEF